ncbi:18541_t:CDS:1, partial [Rhizophagus irregularis]
LYDIIKEQSAINGSMSTMSNKLDQLINFMGFGPSLDLIDGGDDDEEE